MAEIVTMLNSITVREGNTTTITCEAIGYPPPTIIWYKINQTLGDKVSVSDSVPTVNEYVTRVSVNLTITNTSRDDAGDYKCFANNSIGSDSRNISITVHCKLYMYL